MTVPVAGVWISLAATVLVLQTPVVPGPIPAIVLAAGFLGLTAALAAARSRHGWRSAGIAAILAAPPGVALVQAALWEARQLPLACEREAVAVEGSVLGLPRYFRAGDRSLQRVDLRVRGITPQRCAGPRTIRVYLPGPDRGDAEQGAAVSPGAGSEASGEPGLLPGASLALEARLRRPWGLVNPAARTGEREYLLSRIHARGSASLAASPEEPGRLGPHAAVARLRDSLSARVREVQPGVTGFLLAALAVGDKRSLEPAHWERMRIFGVTHLFVISGLHVSLVALPGWYVGAVLGALFRAGSGLTRALPVLTALAFAGTYTLLAGASLPTRRALLMLAVLLVPRVFGRAAAPARGLALAVLILILTDPLAVLGSSFWLSVGAVALLLWCVSWHERVAGPASLLRTQLFLLLAMLPLTLFWFGTGSGVGGLINLLAIPVVSLLILPCLLVGLALECLAVAPGLEFFEPLARIVLSCAGRVLGLGWTALGHLESPVRAWAPVRFTAPAVLLPALLSAALLSVLPLRGGVCLLMALLAGPAFLPRSGAQGDSFEVTVFDVGQGTAVLVRAGGESLLYDTGPGPADGPPVADRAIRPYLTAQGIGALRYLIVSHPDLDHSAGEDALQAVLEVGRVVRGVPAGDRGEACRPGQLMRLGEAVRIRILSGGPPGADSDNNASCVALVMAREHRFLLPGDIDRRQEREVLAYWGARVRSDVLLAAHHGSATSTSRLWLRGTAPEHVVVTAGRANRFGHPARPVVAAVTERGAALLNTAISGALRYTVDADGTLRCRRLRHRFAPFWRRGPHDPDCRRESAVHAGIIRATPTGDS